MINISLNIKLMGIKKSQKRQIDREEQDKSDDEETHQ
jgi:hypothetical protein